MTLKTDKFVTITVCTVAILFGLSVKLAPSIFFSIGKTNLKNQKYVNAYTYFKKAYNFDKKNKDYRYYYVQSLLHLTPTAEIQKCIFEIANGEQDDSAQQAAEEQVAIWRNNVLKSIGNNYIEQVPFDNGIIRWDIDKFPIKVITIDESKTNIPSYYIEEINRAFSQWQRSTNFIKFANANDVNEADIIVKIIPLPANVCNENGCKYVVGYTTPSIKGKLLKNMKIILYAKDPLGNFVSDKGLYNTILHEIGHALGIMGHSYSSEDLMYMASDNNNIYSQYKSSFQYLSSNDINTIKLLYKLIPTITNSENINTKGLVYAPIILGTSKEISKRKLKEAQNYIKNAPNLPSGYIDLGIAYAELNKPKDAIKAMLQGYEKSSTKQEKYLSSFNLAMIYLQINDIDNAEKFVNIAKSNSLTEEVRELEANIKLAKSQK